MSNQLRRRAVDLADQLTDAIGEARTWWDQAQQRIVDDDTRQRAEAGCKKQASRIACKPVIDCPTIAQR
jgi:hypothetical protein